MNSILRIALALPLLALAACNATIGERMGESLTVVRGFQISEHVIPATVLPTPRASPFCVKPTRRCWSAVRAARESS